MKIKNINPKPTLVLERWAGALPMVKIIRRRSPMILKLPPLQIS